MPSGQQQPGTENSGVYTHVCVPDPRSGENNAVPAPPIEAWRRVLPPLTRPPKGWQPLWVTFRAYKNWRTKEQFYLLTYGQPTYASALQAYEAECERIKNPDFDIGSCWGWVPSQYPFF